MDASVRRARRVLPTLSAPGVTDLSLSCSTVTEKAYESESYSEAEDAARGARPAPARPAAGNKPEDKKGQKKSSANASKGAKQASITGFFQKK